MKKIFLTIILIISLLSLSGCNYVELNDMGIVTLMAIKYENNNYEITLELRENIKDNDNASTIHKGKGSSIEKALQELELGVDKHLYFIDLNVILIDENTINEKLTSIIDYLTRDVSFGTKYNIVVDNNPDNTIKMIKSKNKIVGEYIKNIFNNKNNNVINSKFDETLKSYLNEYKDLILPLGQIDKEEYTINKAVIFNNQKIVSELSLDEIVIFNLINNIASEYYFKINYLDKTLVYRVSTHKVKTFYKDYKINIDVKLNGTFIEIEDINLMDENTLNEVLNLLNLKIKKDFESLIMHLQKDESDILAFKKAYYNSERTKINTIKNLDYQINEDINLNREGLIFNSIGDTYEKTR